MKEEKLSESGVVKFTKKSTIELVTSGVLPFLSLVLLGMVNFVSFGFRLPDKSFYIDTVINAIALLCFFVPFKSIFINRFMRSERVVQKQTEYAEIVSEIYSEDKIEAVDRWCNDTNYNKRKDDYIKRTLVLTGVTPDEYKERYMMSNKAIKSAKLPRQKKRILIKLNRNIQRIRPTRVSDLLPSTESITVFNELTSSMKRADRSSTMWVLLKSVVVCFGLAMLAVTTDFTTPIMPIVISLCLKLIVGLWHIYIASTVASKLVNNVYISELSEKIFVLSKFNESNRVN